MFFSKGFVEGVLCNRWSPATLEGPSGEGERVALPGGGELLRFHAWETKFCAERLWQSGPRAGIDVLLGEVVPLVKFVPIEEQQCVGLRKFRKHHREERWAVTVRTVPEDSTARAEGFPGEAG